LFSGSDFPMMIDPT